MSTAAAMSVPTSVRKPHRSAPEAARGRGSPVV